MKKLYCIRIEKKVLKNIEDLAQKLNTKKAKIIDAALLNYVKEKNKSIYNL